MGRKKLLFSMASILTLFYVAILAPAEAWSGKPKETIAQDMENGAFGTGEKYTRFKVKKEHRGTFKAIVSAPLHIVEDVVDEIKEITGGIGHKIGGLFHHGHHDEEEGDQKASFIGVIPKLPIVGDLFNPSKQVAEDPVERTRPQTPTLRFDFDHFGIGRAFTDEEVGFLTACDMEQRLGLDDPFAQKIRSYNRQNLAIENPFGALVYDDGSIQKDVIEKAFKGVIGIEGDQAKLPVTLASSNANPYKCDAGNHATAVTSTMRQTFASTKFPIAVVGGDGRWGDYSNGESIDTRYVSGVIKDLRKSSSWKSKLGSPVVLNASYGFGEVQGDFKDQLDEGGLWKEFWNNVQDSVVIQAAGNEGTELSGNESGPVFETAYNMNYAFQNKNLWGRFIHAMASVPTQNDHTQQFEPGLATDFSNYYRYLETPFSAFARDHSLMAPGEFVLIPLDAFDQDHDGDILEKGKMLTQWAGTSAAAPVTTGSILRFVNEYKLSAKTSAAVLLDNADLIYVEKARGLLKNLNLGAALIALERDKAHRIIAEKDLLNAPLAEKASFFEGVRQSYFAKNHQDLTYEEINYLFDIAYQLGILKSYRLDEAPAFGDLYDLSMTQVSGNLQQGIYIHRAQAGNDLTEFSLIYIYDPGTSHLTGIELAEVNGRTATFRLSYNEPTELQSHQLTWKGIIDTELSIAAVEGSNNTQYDVKAKVGDYFESQRLFTLIPRNQIIAGLQNNHAYFDTDKFIK